MQYNSYQHYSIRQKRFHYQKFLLQQNWYSELLLHKIIPRSTLSILYPFFDILTIPVEFSLNI